MSVDIIVLEGVVRCVHVCNVYYWYVVVEYVIQVAERNVCVWSGVCCGDDNWSSVSVYFDCQKVCVGPIAVYKCVCECVFNENRDSIVCSLCLVGFICKVSDVVFIVCASTVQEYDVCVVFLY